MSTFRRRLLTNQALRVAKGDLIYPGLVAAWSAEGKTNEDSDRDILKDLTGHGHDITLNNMAYAGMSGYGGHRNYAQGSENEVKITSVENKLNAIIKLGYKVTGLKKGDIITMSVDCEAYNINFDSNSGINIYFDLRYSYNGFNLKIISNGKTHLKKVLTLNNHYNSSDPVTEEDDGAPYIRFDYITFNEGGYFLVKNFTVVKGEEEVEWFKDYQYPNALVFDGVDDYGICENMPIQNDFTIIAKREFGTYGCLFGKNSINGAFIFDGFGLYNKIYSYGTSSNPELIKDYISWMVPTSYNGIGILKGNGIDTNTLVLGKYNKNDARYFKSAFYSAYLFNKSLEESEIKSFIRKYIDPEYLLPSEIPTPDCYYDFSLGSNEDENRETIVDQSGNGNDAKAYNFAWSGMSGYGGYETNFNLWDFKETGGTAINRTSTKFTITSMKISGRAFPYINFQGYKNFKIKVSGITTEQIKFGGEYFGYIEIKNGINDLSGDYGTSSTRNSGFRSETVLESCNITIEILPEYPGALVLDGTDDYIALESFDSGFKTIFMVCEWNNYNCILYDQRKDVTQPYDFAIHVPLKGDNAIAYNSRNVNGTYINGKYNTTIKILDLISKKHLINIKSKLTKETIMPVIGVNLHKNWYFSNMAIYKFLGFKEELTDDLILYVIKKYNLLDGVDEIEETT